jgi:hypothetical protein
MELDRERRAAGTCLPYVPRRFGGVVLPTDTAEQYRRVRPFNSLLEMWAVENQKTRELLKRSDYMAKFPKILGS